MISVHENRVIDNRGITMVEALTQLMPQGLKLDIAVGYFFVSGYHLIRESFNQIAMQSTVRIIIGNQTDFNTVQEIDAGLCGHSTIGKPPFDALQAEICDLASEPHLSVSAYMLRDLIAAGQVHVRVYTGPADYFHAKAYMIGRQDQYDGYAIIGSSNFSRAGFLGNSELNVLTKDSYPSLSKWFDNLWDSDDVSDFSLDLMKIIDKYVPIPPHSERLIFDKGTSVEDEKPSVPFIPSNIELRDYQKKAIITWINTAKGRGLLEMATGTGKTVTAMAASVKLFEGLGRLAVIIICPYQHLVTQWARECRLFGFTPILCYKSRGIWEEKLNAEIVNYNIGVTQAVSIITTNDSFVSDAFQNSIANIKGPIMLIADEAHNLGAAKTYSRLPDYIPFRLGLSATPERWYDEEGTQALKDYFENGIIFRFGLKEAIAEGYLTPYYYYPHLVYLTDDENEEYWKISRAITKLTAFSGKLDLDDESLKLLLIKRSRLVSRAENKLVVLEEIMRDQAQSSHTIFYCGDAKTDGERQIERVIQLLGKKLGMRVHPFTSEEKTDERSDLLNRFESGNLQGLVAIRCLDEGVDVPATQTAFIMSSSTNPREFVQRRGRILRRFPGKKHAFIHDFIVVPSGLDEISHLEPAVFNMERNLMKRELRRFREFAVLAVNGPVAKLSIMEIAEKYNLLDY